MFRIVIKRCEKDNPLTGRARYRVVDCWEANTNRLTDKRVNLIDADEHEWMLNLPRPRRINTFINPAKAMFG